MANMEREPILSARDVEISFSLRGKKLNAIRRCSLDLYQGETLAIVGESGSGKSVFTKSFLGMLDANGSITGGSILFEGKDLAKYKTEKDWMTIRGKKISMVMQDPMTSLNPLKKIGRQIEESIELNQGIKGPEAKKMALEMLKKVGIPDPERRYQQYPHEFSGGQRQRICIARALALNPEFVVCDEPVSALDASVQAQILNLLRQVQEDFGPAYLFISHDLAVVGFMCPRILVMYLGRFVEEGPRERLLREPAHPYTRALLASVPSFEDLRDGKSPVRAPRQNIRGELPSPLDPPSGCRFHPRCPQATERCREEAPSWKELEPGWRVRCHLYA